MKKAIATILAMIFVMAIPVTSCALTPCYKVSDAYSKSVYYKRLTEVQLTGDPRTDLVAVAASQVGYHEGNSLDELGGGNTAGSGNYAEAAYYFSGHVMYADFYYAWCAMFVTWCARLAGLDSSIVTTATLARPDGSTTTGNTYCFHVDYTFSKEYIPRPGDLIFFSWDGSGLSWDHVGIVESYKNGVVYTIEGNSGNGVYRRTYNRTSKSIAAFGVLPDQGVSFDMTDPDNYLVPSRTLRAGMSGVDCRWVQAALDFLGENLAIDGDYGSLTSAAVKRFQKANGLIADGIVGEETRKAIIEAVEKKKNLKLDIGDVDGDGRVTSRDYVKIRLHILGKRILDEDGLKYADINGDGKVNSYDYVELRLRLLNG